MSLKVDFGEWVTCGGRRDLMTPHLSRRSVLAILDAHYGDATFNQKSKLVLFNAMLMRFSATVLFFSAMLVLASVL